MMLYTISAIAVIILILDDFSSRALIAPGAVTMRLIKLEYRFTLSILVYNTYFTFLFIHLHGELPLKHTRPNTQVVIGFLSQINKDVAMRTLRCSAVHM